MEYRNRWRNSDALARAWAFAALRDSAIPRYRESRQQFRDFPALRRSSEIIRAFRTIWKQSGVTRSSYLSEYRGLSRVRTAVT